MSLKALATGSTCPPLKPDTLRFYSMRFCPYAERTHLVLAHYNVQYDIVNVNLKQKPEWFLEKNPLGLVPVLEHGERIIYESPICDEYLDEVYGKRSLLTTDPHERARQKILMERFNKVIAQYLAILRETGEKKKSLESFHEALNVFEEALPGKFFGGDAVSLLDYHIWPWFERFPMLEQRSGLKIEPEEKFPKLSAWATRMKEQPAVKTALIGTDLHLQFINEHLKGGIPNYDIGLE